MSYAPNQTYVESKLEQFDDALFLDNFGLANKIVHELADNGFSSESVTLAVELNKAFSQEAHRLTAERN